MNNYRCQYNQSDCLNALALAQLEMGEPLTVKKYEAFCLKYSGEYPSRKRIYHYYANWKEALAALSSLK